MRRVIVVAEQAAARKVEVIEAIKFMNFLRRGRRERF